MSNFWSDKKVLVTGGAGFIGKHVVRNLIELRGMDECDIRIPILEECDLRIMENALRAVKDMDIVIHLAADVGGLSYSLKYPARQYYNCSILDLQVFEAAKEVGVNKIVAMSSTTAYPDNVPLPLKEEDLFGAGPAKSHLGYGWAKRNLISLAQVYHQQYQDNFIVVIANNVYGPGDNFDPETSHVIPATIRKCFQQDKLVVWGDGSPVRDFLYVEDLAEAIVSSAELLKGLEYFNVASGKEISIGELVQLISSLCNFKGEILSDASKPKGEPKRTVDIGKAKRLINFSPRFSLEQGLIKTIDWYKKEIKK